MKTRNQTSLDSEKRERVELMEKVWLKNYQPGVPAVIDPARFASLNEMFLETCNRFKDKAAFTNLNQAITFAELEEKTRFFAAYLQSALGLKIGDRIALMMPNLLQYPIALFGALRAGLIVVNVNPLYTPRELEYQLSDAECDAIIVLANFANTLAKVLKKVKIKHIIVTEVGDILPFPKALLVNWVVKYLKKMVPAWKIPGHQKFREALALGAKQKFVKPIITGEDIAFLQYTGGTTGIAKGAMLTHRNMVANIEQTSAWIKPAVKPGEEIIITALPLYHIFSLTANCFTFMRVGALNVLITNPRDIKGFIKILGRYRFTAITGVNTLFNALLNQPAFANLDFSALRIALGGGMSIQRAVALRWKAITKVPLLEAYGLTETCPAVCINPFNLKDYNGSIGLPISSTDICIRDDRGLELGFNTPGELCVRGPQVMRGYWKLHVDTEDVLQDGWLRTGDIATVDEEGYVRIVDRKKNMILVSGFNVYPNEVEDVIAMMPQVLEVAVIGVPREDGEKVKAFIVKKDPHLTAEWVKEYCHTQLTGYKVPKEIEFCSELPKSNVGKILHRVLREKEKLEK